MEQIEYVQLWVKEEYVHLHKGKFEVVKIGSVSMFKLTDGKNNVKYFNPAFVVYMEPSTKEIAMHVYEDGILPF